MIIICQIKDGFSTIIENATGNVLVIIEALKKGKEKKHRKRKNKNIFKKTIFTELKESTTVNKNLVIVLEL